MPIKPGLGTRLAHGPFEGDAHGTFHFEAGVEFAVNALHDREFLHAGGQFLVGEGVQAGILDGDRGLPGKGCQQVLVVIAEGQSVAAVDDFDHADDAVLDLQGVRPAGRGW